MLTITVVNNGLAACAQILPADLTSLPGTVTTAASAGPFTVTVDLRDYLVVGDLISFSGQNDVVYGVKSMAATTVTLYNAYGGTTGAGQTMTKCSFNTPSGTPSPAQSNGAGTVTLPAADGVTVTGSSTTFTTTFSAGDAIAFTQDTTPVTYVIRSIASDTSLTLETGYNGSQAGLSGKTYVKANFAPRRHDGSASSNKSGRFGTMAVGTSSTAAGSLDTGLGAEITANGFGRRSGSNVTTFLTSADSGVSWKSNWQTTFTSTGTQAISEVEITNDPVANRGTCLLRQTMTTLNLIANDVLNLLISLSHSATATATGVVDSIGLKEAAKLIMDQGTALGTDNPTTPGSTWSSNQGTQFDTIALGTGATAPALADVTLQTEISANGTTRQTGSGVPGTIMRNPDNSNVTPFTFSTDTFTSFAGDTVQWRATFSITGAQSIQEQGVFNGSTAGNADPAGGSRMLIHQVFAAALSFVNSDTYLPVIRAQST